jgi:hypothetical protein
MRREIADAVCSGAVVLVAARFTYLDALAEFLGGPPTVLASSAAAIADWVHHAVATGQPQTVA